MPCSGRGQGAEFPLRERASPHRERAKKALSCLEKPPSGNTELSPCKDNDLHGGLYHETTVRGVGRSHPATRATGFAKVGGNKKVPIRNRRPAKPTPVSENVNLVLVTMIRVRKLVIKGYTEKD